MSEIRPAEVPRDLDTARTLFREYADSLGVDLCFQNFEAELANLPGYYHPPDGRLLLAWNDAGAVGCVALRRLDTSTCEMKRLYVRPDARGTGTGLRLAKRICDEARAAGYRRICLDTLPTLTRAIAMYTHMGFRPIEPYVHNPVPGAIFLGLDL